MLVKCGSFNVLIAPGHQAAEKVKGIINKISPPTA
jgi:hypothetical protein